MAHQFFVPLPSFQPAGIEKKKEMDDGKKKKRGPTGCNDGPAGLLLHDAKYS